MAEQMTDNQGAPVAQAAEDLFNYAIDREDVKWLLAHLHQQSAVNRHTVEYELQILKLITVGWSIAYYLENSPFKMELSEAYWQAVQQFSQELSESTELMVGQQIDYFETLKTRLNMYVAVLQQYPEAQEPATVIGPAFAETCGSAEDIFAFMTGSKMFMGSTQRVREYLSHVGLI
jgi:hypothetical protein